MHSVVIAPHEKRGLKFDLSGFVVLMLVLVGCNFKTL